MHTTRQYAENNRRGFLSPMVAFSLLTVMTCLALGVNRLWFHAARVELDRCSEAAALAAARELISDDRLRPKTEPRQHMDAAQRRARVVAQQNPVGATAVDLGEDEVVFGRRVRHADSGRNVFLRTKHDPTTVVVTARFNRGPRNPVAGLFGESVNEVASTTAATIDNRILGVQPYDGVPIPALPIAILHRNADGERQDTWRHQITRRNGSDRLSFHADSGEVRAQPDGIPEIVLRSVSAGSDPGEANMQLLNLNPHLPAEAVLRQIRQGWNGRDLQALGGKLRLSGEPIWLPATTRILSTDIRNTFYAMKGQPRIVVLYDAFSSGDTFEQKQIRVSGLSAGRIMAMRSGQSDVCEIAFQPAVVVTHAALLAEESSATQNVVNKPNRYIYKLHLTPLTRRR